jgi:membrane-associated phospholipid phosphatase
MVISFFIRGGTQTVNKEISNIDENFLSSPGPLQFIKDYYYVIVGAFFVLLTIFNYFLKIIPVEYSGYLLLVAFTCFTVISDVNKNIKVKAFLCMAIPYIIVILVIFANGNTLWHSVLRWEMDRGIIFNINSLFNHIPFNDAAFARIFQPQWLTTYMQMVYNTGFVLAVLVPLFRAVMSIDFKKMLKYTLSAHIFQVLIITPFYIVFYLQEVWDVRWISDPLTRHLNPAQTLETTLNCFPSMHTSIAFAMFLLVIREKNKIFKWVWSFYCLSIIYSTMYLEIHWVIDVIGGLILGYGTVKFVDFIMSKAEGLFPERLKSMFLKNYNSITYDE